MIDIYRYNSMDKSGIYKITNTANGKFYIGSSINLKQRFNEHIGLLTKNSHPNFILQRSWNKHGVDKFTFEIIEECAHDQKICFEREQYYLDLLKPYLEVGYNISKHAAGGDNFTLNPNKEAIREKMRILNAGDKNGMFGRTHNDSTKNEMKNKAKGRFSLEWFVERNGQEFGTQKYQERRKMLSSRKINYSHVNKNKGKKIVVESTRGDSVSRGRNALKGRKIEFLLDISNQEISSKQIADKYTISTAAVKYHRNKLKK
jgi:group I intron endonuclease